MSPEDLEEWLQRKPFEPFRVTTTTGKAFDVRHPDAMWVGDTRCTLGVFDSMNPNRSVDISVQHIVMIELVPPPLDLASLAAKARGKPK